MAGIREKKSRKIGRTVRSTVAIFEAVSAMVGTRMFITRYCRDEHNVARRGAQLQVGTVKKYRELDDEFLGDPHEATLPTWLQHSGPPIPADQAMFDQLTANSDAQVTVVPGRVTFLDGATVGTVKRWPNAFVVCCRVESVRPRVRVNVPEISADYDSCYVIASPDAFADSIARKLRRALLGPKLPLIPQRRIVWAHGPVQYSDQGGLVVRPRALENGVMISTTLTQSIFRKGVRFSPQAEYRFVFALVASNGLVEDVPVVEQLVAGPFPGVEG